MLSDIGILIVLILLNGFFASAEIVLLSVNANKVKIKAEQGDKIALRLKNILEDPNDFLSTIQIGISLVGLFSGAFAAQAFSDEVVFLLQKMGVQLPGSVLKTVTVLVITLILSYFTLIFGELVPKRVGMKKAENLAPVVIWPIFILAFLTKPFVKLLSFSTNFILRLIGIDPNKTEIDVTEEEIRMLVDTGPVGESEKEMINNIFKFDDTRVGDIATHRTEIVAIDVESDMEELIKVITEEKFSRIPVFEEDIDNIIGVLHVKDVMQYLIKHGIHEKVDLYTLLREPYFVPEPKKTDELFKELQLNKVHMAIVIDEYGGTAGLVTMEDLIEEVMGNIFDEYDEEEDPDINPLEENQYEIKGIASLEKMSDYFQMNFPLDEYDTLGGFIIGQLGRIPGEDEKPEVEFEGLTLKVVRVEDKRVATVIASKVEETDE